MRANEVICTSYKKKLLMRPNKTIDQITGIRIIINKITFYIDH